MEQLKDGQKVDLAGLILAKRRENLNNRIEGYGRRTVEWGLHEIPPMDIVDFKELEEGCETWVEGHPYPLLGSFQYDKVETVRQFKNLATQLMRSFKRHKVSTAIYLLFNFDALIDLLHHGVASATYEDPKRYCRAVREVHKALSGKSKRMDKVRDIVCAVMENDTAYRYRVQCFFSTASKFIFYDTADPLGKEITNYKKDIKTLLQAEIQHEKDPKVNSQMETLKKVLAFVPERWVRNFFRHINISEVELAEGDFYWICDYKDHDFAGLPFDSRQDRKKEMKQKNAGIN